MSDARLASRTAERLSLFEQGEYYVHQCEQLITFLDKDD